MTSGLSQEKERKSPAHGPCTDAAATIYPGCHANVGSNAWQGLTTLYTKDPRPETFPNLISLQRDELELPAYLAELARLEWAIYQAGTARRKIPSTVERLIPNPTVQIIEMSWKNLPGLLNGKDSSLNTPEPGEELVLVWQHPFTGHANAVSASDEDLLVLKIIVEGIDPQVVAEKGGLPIGAVDAAIRRATSRGVLLAPRSLIRRDTADFPTAHDADERFLSSSFFTLQWHITQACDLHCKHCYDRSSRSPLNLEQGLRILDNLRDFCKNRHVRGQVSFTGGNPLLHPHFFELYQAATEKGLVVAILGNPTPRKQIEELLAIQRPVFFQVSLEGLEAHNDHIRGSGHFSRVMEFLKLLQELEISSKVMLTLTKGNINQVLPLAKMLRHKTDDFTFNRLSLVGEGANLQLPSRNEFAQFLEDYLEASKNNPTMGWKDNFINILCHQKDLNPFGGCTGYGCGAAFNFMAVLSDGKVHACRKFPSLIGNLYKQSIAEIYDSETARQYRRGPSECRSCPIHLVCRGCLAVAFSHGLDVFEQRDPYCFMPVP